ncbi:MAG: LytTR family transcriptional regulator [Bacteroidetes bacterium]|nr:LytTR family transcriptional regulator [Bacteroidota bacterium]
MENHLNNDKTPEIQTDNGSVFIKTNSHMRKIPTDDILWIEALGNYVVFNTINNRYTVHATMKSLENKLPAEFFIRVHRSFIIHLNKIGAIQGQIVTIDKKWIPIGKSFRKRLINQLNFL